MADQVLSPADQAAMQPETFVNPLVQGTLAGVMNLPKNLIDAGAKFDPNDIHGSSARVVPAAADTAMALMGGSSVVPAEANSLRMGIKAYHGSPHDFDKFDMSKIGTGEGAQAFGHGLYFAENPAVAESYANKLGKLDKPGHIYETDINAHPNDFLDWHKSIKDQSPAVRQLNERIQDELPIENRWSGITKPEFGRDLHENFHDWVNYNFPKQQDPNLSSYGIPGVKYLDNFSRQGGSQTSNYSVMNDKLLKILKKY